MAVLNGYQQERNGELEREGKKCSGTSHKNLNQKTSLKTQIIPINMLYFTNSAKGNYFKSALPTNSYATSAGC